MTEPKRKIELLFVDDDDEIRERAVQFFSQGDYRVSAAASGEEAVAMCKTKVFDVAVLDLKMPGMSGMEVFEKIQENREHTEVIILTGHGTIETAVTAMKNGAHDFLTKPVRFKHLALVVDRAAMSGHFRKENSQLRAIFARTKQSGGMVGESKPMKEVFRLIDRVGPTDNPILIEGESGTGKELVAKAIHEASLLAEKPLVVINCAALPDSLLESELFGYEKGAFTGATTTKEGLFEIADNGTLFIDEIGELSPALQPKLLRVLEDGWMRRVGSTKDRHVKVRIIAATNRNLADEVEAKTFREDLYYRINVLTITLPPLRDRKDDIVLLAKHFGGEWDWEPEAIAAIRAHRWPGNVRQLRNAVERAKILADDDTIKLANLPPELQHGKVTHSSEEEHRLDLATINRGVVVEAMRGEKGNKLRAAKSLGINRRSLYRLLEKYKIKDEEYCD